MVVCMEKYAWRGKIVPGMQEEYKKRHDNIWPEMKEVLAKAGIVNYSISDRQPVPLASELPELSALPGCVRFWPPK